MWRDVFELASREPHFRILRRAAPGEWFDQAAAAVANESTQQSVSKPLSDLEDARLLERQSKRRRAIYRLTSLGESVRSILLHGPQIREGAWMLAIADGNASPADVRALASSQDVALWRCAGDFGLLVVADANSDDLVDDLTHRLRQIGADASKGLITRVVDTRRS
jgi:DNA-binding HxlR family transcriptional regulator